MAALSDLHEFLSTLDIHLRYFLFNHHSSDAVCAPLRTRAHLGCGHSQGTQVDLPPRLSRRRLGEPAAGKSHRAVEALIRVGNRGYGGDHSAPGLGIEAGADLDSLRWMGNQATACHRD